MQKHYKSDFTLSLVSSADCGDLVNLCSECDFSGTVRSGLFSAGLHFSHKGKEYTNCLIKDGRLLIICNSHNLSPGRVVVQLCVEVPNADFPDGFERLTTVIPTGLVLTASGGSELGEAEVKAVIPYVSPYAVAVRGGFQGTEAEFNGLLRKLPEYEGLMRSMDAQLNEKINATNGEIKRVDVTVDEMERDKYYKMWLAVKGTSTVVLKVRAGGKVTMCFDGVLDASGQPVNPVVKHADPDRDTFMSIDIPLNANGTPNVGGFYNRIFRQANGQFYGTNETDILELAALDAEKIKNFCDAALSLPSPNIYYREWDMSGKTSIIRILFFSGITGTLDLRNWDLSKCETYGAWNYYYSPFPKEITRVLLPEGFLGENWPKKNIELGTVFAYLENITSCEQIEPNPENWDVSEITDFGYLFYNSNFKSLDLSKWRTPKATSFRIFIGFACEWVDISGFDTGAVNLVADPYSMSFCNHVLYQLRWAVVGPALFKAQACTFVAPKLGQNDDGSSNGCLEQFLEKMPIIRNKETYEELLEQEGGVWYLNDGKPRTLALHANLKNKAWAQPILAEMQAKGYTIA